MKMMSGFNLRFLLAGCALAMGIGASSTAMAMPKGCYDFCAVVGNYLGQAAFFACLDGCGL